MDKCEFDEIVDNTTNMILESKNKISHYRHLIKVEQENIKNNSRARANAKIAKSNARMSYIEFVESYYYNQYDGKIYNKDNTPLIEYDMGGYKTVRIDGSDFKVHRLAFLYMNKTFPRETVDHIDNNPANNIWENLREATRVQNGFNKPKFKCNTSGYRGVSFYKPSGRWTAQATIDSKTHYIGRYDTPEEASLAYQNYIKAHHGDFLNEDI